MIDHHVEHTYFGWYTVDSNSRLEYCDNPKDAPACGPTQAMHLVLYPAQVHVFANTVVEDECFANMAFAEVVDHIQDELSIDTFGALVRIVFTPDFDSYDRNDQMKIAVATYGACMHDEWFKTERETYKQLSSVGQYEVFETMARREMPKMDTKEDA